MSPPRRVVCHGAALFGVVAIVIAFAVPAAAADNAQSAGNLAAERAVVAKLAGAPDQKAAFQSLSTSEKSLYVQSLSNLKATTIVSSGGSSGHGCWWHYQYDSWSDLGVHEGDTWMQLDWCTRTGQTVTWFWTHNYGGRGDLIHYDGVVAHHWLNVGWEVRSYVEFHFDVMNMANAYPCMQIRGGHTGLYSTQRSCNLS